MKIKKSTKKEIATVITFFAFGLVWVAVASLIGSWAERVAMKDAVYNAVVDACADISGCVIKLNK